MAVESKVYNEQIWGISSYQSIILKRNYIYTHTHLQSGKLCMPLFLCENLQSIDITKNEGLCKVMLLKWRIMGEKKNIERKCPYQFLKITIHIFFRVMKATERSILNVFLTLKTLYIKKTKIPKPQN